MKKVLVYSLAALTADWLAIEEHTQMDFLYLAITIFFWYVTQALILGVNRLGGFV